jgi:hypothetical protein
MSVLRLRRGHACRHLENLKAELIDNRDLAGDYPQLAGRGPVWRTGSIVLPNGVCIEAFGTGQRLCGRRRRKHRPTRIVCDDLVNQINKKEPAQLKRHHVSSDSTHAEAFGCSALAQESGHAARRPAARLRPQERSK